MLKRKNCSKKPIKDKNAPKPALNSYNFYMQDKLNKLKLVQPDTAQNELMGIIGKSIRVCTCIYIIVFIEYIV